MTVVAWIAGSILTLAALGAILRLVRGPSALDRAAALEVLLSCCIGAIAVVVATRRESSLLIVLAVLALVAFVGSVSIARFASARGDE